MFVINQIGLFIKSVLVFMEQNFNNPIESLLIFFGIIVLFWVMKR